MGALHRHLCPALRHVIFGVSIFCVGGNNARAAKPDVPTRSFTTDETKGDREQPEAAEQPEVAEQSRSDTRGARPPRQKRCETPTHPSSNTRACWVVRNTSAIPIVFYTPENEFGFGAGLLTTWKGEDQPALRPDFVLLALMQTTLRQTIGSLNYQIRDDAERHILDQELRFIHWPDQFYGIGNNTNESDVETFIDHYWQVETSYRYLAWKKLYVGLGHTIRWSKTPGVQDSPQLLTEENLFGIGATRWSGLRLTATWDSRNATFWPTSGVFASADSTFYLPVVGSDFRAHKFRLDSRAFFEISDGFVFAPRFVFHAAPGDNVPFQLIPQLGGSDLFRGWFLGRLRDRYLVAVEAEQRIELSKRFSVVGFTSWGRVAPSFTELRPTQLRTAFGGGLRFAIKKELRANLRLDVAYGDRPYVYLQFKEAF